MIGWLIVERLEVRPRDDARCRVRCGRRPRRDHAVRRFRRRARADRDRGIAGIVCYLAISLKFKFGYDDSLDVVAVHLVGGLIGSILLGLFADASVNAAGQGRRVLRRRLGPLR